MMLPQLRRLQKACCLKTWRVFRQMTIYLCLAIGVSPAAFSCNTATTSPATSFLHDEVTKIQERKFEIALRNLLKLRNQEFASARIVFLADPEAVEYLMTRFSDADPVVAFSARQLYIWAGRQDDIFRLEHFLTETEPALRKIDITAKGGGGVKALFRYLGPYLKSPDNATALLLSHLLFRNLMEPGVHSYIGQMLFQYYSTFPVPEPEVWIRTAIERSDNYYLDYLIEKSLIHVETRRLKRALLNEKMFSARAKSRWPDQLEKFLKSVSE